MNEKNKDNKNLKPKILYVEDDEVSIDVVTRLLKNKYEIESVNNGEDALKYANENDYEAFLIDIGLQGNMDGIQVTKELKKINNNHSKPYIAITAYALYGDKEFFLSAGLTHYISKPFESAKLIELIEKAIPSKQKKNSKE